MTATQAESQRFTRNVASVFGMQVVVSVVGIVNAFLLARLLGPADKGDYYFLLLIPSTLLVFGMLGIPASLTYFAGRGMVNGLTRRAIVLALGLASVLVALAMLVLIVFQPSLLPSIDYDLVALALLSTPFQFVVAFGSGLLIGRRAIRQYALILIAQVIAATILIITLIGFLDLGVRGGVLMFLLLNAGTASAMVYVAVRMPSEPGPGHDAPPNRDLLGYGLRIWPGSMMTFFSYRADVYLIAWLLASPTALGIYSVAVGLAEIVFKVPDSVSTVFFPQVAASTPEEAARTSPEITRVTLLVTAGAAILLVPMAAVALAVVLPAFIEALAPLVVLLPGVVLLSVAKVLSSLITGSGKAGVVSIVAVIVAVVNVATNLALIPVLGIVGASLASTISYGLEAVLLVAIAARLTGQPPLAFLIPHRSDFGRILSGIRSIVVRLKPTSPKVAPR